MNQRKAKSFRRMANTLNQSGTQYNDDYRIPRYQQVGFQFIKVQKGVPLTLRKSCTRKIYQEMKKNS